MTNNTMTARERVLRTLKGEKVTPVPCFSGVGNVTTKGLDKLGYRFADLHNDAKKMAEAGMSTWELFGYECVVIPFDLCMEAEALGCVMNPYAETNELLYPTIKEKSKLTSEQLRQAATPELLTKGRIPMIIEAARLVREKVGDKVAIGSYVLGPFTLGGQINELEPLLKGALKKPDEMLEYLDAMADVIILVANHLLKNGIDYVSVREMGATSDVLSPRVFKKVIFPSLKKVADKVASPTILHICGSVLPVIDMMAECGFDALSIDSKTPMKEARAKVGEKTVILGNFNPFAALNTGSADEAYNIAAQCVKDGVNGVHPGCDIWPTAKPENIEAMIRAVRETSI
ncbi:MAG: MtaA/CmuA family methyltransferase [Nitrospinota bacterium]|nr:MtaA/CmuA family methyltransferase [Nitrospinota bacterium]